MSLWDAAYEATPPDTGESPSLGAGIIRALETEIRQRINQEFVFYNTNSTGGFVPRSGACRAYYQAAAPTLRPDGLTSLGASDTGRLWIDSDDMVTKGWTGATWADLSIGGNAATATLSEKIADQYGGSDVMVKFIPIGVWNMDSTSSVNIAHGLTWTKIRDVSVWIYDDGVSYAVKLDSDGTADINGYYNISTTNIVLVRTAGETFDGTDFNDAVMNRGYVTVWYTE